MSYKSRGWATQEQKNEVADVVDEFMWSCMTRKELELIGNNVEVGKHNGTEGIYADEGICV